MLVRLLALLLLTIALGCSGQSHCPQTQYDWDVAYILHQLWLSDSSQGERLDLRGCDLTHIEIRNPLSGGRQKEKKD